MRVCKTGLLHSQDVIHQFFRFLLSYRHSVTILWHFHITPMVYHAWRGSACSHLHFPGKHSLRVAQSCKSSGNILEGGTKIFRIYIMAGKTPLLFCKFFAPTRQCRPCQSQSKCQCQYRLRREFMMHTSKDGLYKKRQSINKNVAKTVFSLETGNGNNVNK